MQVPLLPAERRAEFDAELRRRAIRGGIAAAAGIVLVLIFSGFTVSLFVAAALLLALYAVPWDMWRYGKFVVPAVAILLAVLYPYFRDNLFQVPLFGVFPSTDTRPCSMASSRQDSVRGLVRLNSSARTRLAKMGP